jgi:enediyne biosynthesis protein E4
VITMLVDSMPSQAVKNAVFKNEKNLKFKYVSDEWGFETPTFSNGSAYGDLDNDGDLDIVVNNVNMPSFIYKNNTDTATHRSISIHLKGKDKNTKAIGAKVVAKTNQGSFMMENYTSRGFQSTIDSKLHIGLGDAKFVDSLFVYWPDGSFSVYTHLKTNTTHTINQGESFVKFSTVKTNIESSCSENDISFKHQEIDLNLFGRERLLTEMQGFTGPAIAVGDVNKDGKDDVFCGGGKNQASKLFVSTVTGKYLEINTPFDADYRSESVQAHFVDTDNDGDLDLYVAHGGKTFSSVSPELDDVLYINDGRANFTRASITFPESISTAKVSPADVNGDKLTDFVVAEAMKTDMYGLHGSIYLMTNLGNNRFKTEMIPASKDLGMLTDIKLFDINGDQSLDIMVCGKWMPLTYFLSNKGNFSQSKPMTLENSSGLWNVLETIDLDGDGDLDVIAGNEGENSFLKSGMTMFVSDFDDNGSHDPIICESTDKKYFPIHDLDELFSQLPVLKKKFGTYRDFATVSLDQMFDGNKIQKARKYTLDLTKSIVLINQNKDFQIANLPSEVQYSCIHSIFARSVKGDVQMLLGGNFYNIKPQFGRQDGSYGWKVDWKGGFSDKQYNVSPLFINGQIRHIVPFGDQFIFGINNESLKICAVR